MQEKKFFFAVGRGRWGGGGGGGGEHGTGGMNMRAAIFLSRPLLQNPIVS